MKHARPVRSACLLIALALMADRAEARSFAYSADGRIYAHGDSAIRIREASVSTNYLGLDDLIREQPRGRRKNY